MKGFKSRIPQKKKKKRFKATFYFLSLCHAKLYLIFHCNLYILPLLSSALQIQGRGFSFYVLVGQIIQQ